MRGFQLTIEPLVGGAARLALRGELDFEHAYTFDEELQRLEVRRPPCLALDLSELTFMDSSGLARLLAAHRRARRDGRRLVLLRPSPPVQRLMAFALVRERFEVANELPAELQAPELAREP